MRSSFSPGVSSTGSSGAEVIDANMLLLPSLPLVPLATLSFFIGTDSTALSKGMKIFQQNLTTSLTNLH